MRKKKKKRSEEDSDSLDLLLDTLTNSLGAIILVALLVALLVQTTSDSIKQPEVDDMASLESLSSELALIELKIESAQEQLSALLENLSRFSDRVSVEQLEEVETALNELRQEQTAKHENIQQITGLNKEAVAMSAAVNEKKALVKQKERIAKEVSRITDNRQKGNQKLIESVEEMATAVEELTTAEKQITLPKVTQSNKRQYSVVIENGYLYTQLSDMVEDQTGLLRDDGRRYRLLGGLDIGDPKSAREAVVSSLDAVSPDASYLAIFIWEDSFPFWEPIRRQLSAMGYRYQLVLLMDDELITTTSDGTDGKVQ